MADYRTLTRIAAAQYDAERMRLPGTADRLDILRREMERFHGYDREKLEIRRRWALAKLEDTERTMKIEKERMTEEDFERIDSMQGMGKLIKTAVYLALTVGVMDMLRRAAGGTMMDIAGVLAGSAAVALAFNSAVERLFGGTFEDAYANIGKAIEECRKTLGGH